MTNPVTPNIGLNKIDRTSPSTTYFDLEKYIDQNADAVDRFAGETSEAIGALEKRLDTEERREVVLQPGLQIVNAERSAPFKLSGIKGRTLVNLAGRWTNRSPSNPATTTLSVGSDTTGNNTEIINVAVTNTDEGYIIYRQVGGSAFLALAGKYYVISAEVKINSISDSGLVKLGANVGIGADAVDKTKLGIWQRIYYGFTKSADTAFDIIVGVCYAGGVYAAVNFDVKNVSLYEISQSEYNNITSYSAEQMDIKYPYVDSIQPVRNPYVIRYGENLAPTLFEGTVESSTKVLSEYSAIVKATGSTVVEYRSKLIPAIPNTNYALRAKITLNGLEKYDGVYVDVLGYDEAGLYVLDTPGTSVNGTGTGTDIFATPANIKTMEVRIVAPQDAAVGDYVIEDITLNLGATVKTHKPREDCILALQTDLYSDPVTGANADEVFEKDGQYFRFAKWGKATLTDKFNYVGIGGKGTGWKQTFFDLLSNTSGPYSETVVKYDGKKLQSDQITNNPDISAIDSGNAKRCYISIANTDSGWGDNYSPTADEIKAYFMGWTMYDGSGSNATPDNPVNNFYNGTGVKAWAYRADGVTRSWLGWTDKLPTTQAPNWTPYQLLYRLAKETIEPIVSEGTLTFNEVDNQIEVGTGIVLRERANSVTGATVTQFNRTDSIFSGTALRNKVGQFLTVYKNGLKDSVWRFEFTLSASNGNYHAYTANADYDPSAAYSVTYLMLDKTPNVPFTGSYAANEKAMLQELTDAVQQNATAVSVLMNKKADKDNSVVWVEPTLINGATEYTETNFRKPSYTKIGNWVKLSGLIKVTVSGTMFYLPPGYRPNKVLIFAGLSGGIASYTMMDLRVTPTGNVTVNTTSPLDWLSLDHIIFQAEQ
ncbi:hypothetical protein [Paenibacillus sp. EZ-K15]|uniref:hypothetical protein n=1 Tax=Paenibacillus sp. EZ-K15 TaxID=2044275 RepID=UPI000BF611D3|nr:hypothetical protein [Paenibacillus sp. EZ-K15]